MDWESFRNALQVLINALIRASNIIHAWFLENWGDPWGIILSTCFHCLVIFPGLPLIFMALYALIMRVGVWLFGSNKSSPSSIPTKKRPFPIPVWERRIDRNYHTQPKPSSRRPKRPSQPLQRFWHRRPHRECRNCGFRNYGGRLCQYCGQPLGLPNWMEDAIGIVLGVIIVLALAWWFGVLPELQYFFRRFR